MHGTENTRGVRNGERKEKGEGAGESEQGRERRKGRGEGVREKKREREWGKEGRRKVERFCKTRTVAVEDCKMVRRVCLEHFFATKNFDERSIQPSLGGDEPLF
jgi:hypothetical protein